MYKLWATIVATLFRVKRILKILVFTLLCYHPPPRIPPRSSVGTRGTLTILGRHFVPKSLVQLPSTHRDAPWSKLEFAREASHVR
jgi:hypothetical protein